MPFLTGKQVEAAPGDVKAFRSQLFDFLRRQGFQTALTGVSDVDIEPFRAQFAQRRAETLAQAKESAGNLTGSGFANVYGAAAGRSVADENAFLAELQERSAQRFLGLLGLPAQYVGQPAYQPGFLDYLFEGVGKAAQAKSGGLF